VANVYTRSVFQLRESGIYVTAATLGQRGAVTFQGKKVVLTIPDADDAFWDEQYPGIPRGGAFGLLRMPPGEREPAVARTVKQLRVEVFFNDVEVGDFPKEMVICSKGAQVAREFVTGFIEYARAMLHHDWLGTSIDRPELIGDTSLFDADSEARFQVGQGEFHYRSPFFDQQTNVSPELLDRILADLAADGFPPFSRRLLYDALYLTRTRHPPDFRLAVFSAAVAVEMQIKQTLEAMCHDEGRALLDALFNNPRDYSVAIVSHLDKTAMAVCGRSLRSEDRELWKRANALFEVRNAIAHGNDPQPSDDDMWGAVLAALDVYRWLLALTGDTAEAPYRGTW
jgi:hypothetical protein